MAASLPKSSTNYNNRLVDIELLSGVLRPDVSIQVTPGITNNTVNMVTGIQKLAQQYTNLLLTDLGSLKFENNIGGSIINSIRKGEVQTEGYLIHLFNMANHNAITIMQNDYTSLPYSKIPADERIKSTNLIDLELDFTNASISIEVEIVSEAGSEYTFIIPVSTGI